MKINPNTIFVDLKQALERSGTLHEKPLMFLLPLETTIQLG